MKYETKETIKDYFARLAILIIGIIYLPVWLFRWFLGYLIYFSDKFFSLFDKD